MPQQDYTRFKILGMIAYPRSFPILIGILTHRDLKMRKTPASILGYFNDHQASAALVTAMRQGNAAVMQEFSENYIAFIEEGISEEVS